jgi:hypothetical protein
MPWVIEVVAVQRLAARGQTMPREQAIEFAGEDSGG